MCVCVQIFDSELKDQEREVCFVDIAYDEIPERYYKESEVRARVFACRSSSLLSVCVFVCLRWWPCITV